MKHKYAEQIKAWADGAKIQEFVLNEWRDTNDPKWYAQTKYRIKPELELDLSNCKLFELHFRCYMNPIGKIIKVEPI